MTLHVPSDMPNGIKNKETETELPKKKKQHFPKFFG
jgi:hypothetical protein